MEGAMRKVKSHTILLQWIRKQLLFCCHSACRCNCKLLGGGEGWRDGEKKKHLTWLLLRPLIVRPVAAAHFFKEISIYIKTTTTNFYFLIYGFPTVAPHVDRMLPGNDL